MAGHSHRGIEAKMRALVTDYQHRADALRLALDIVNGHDTDRKRDQHDQLFAAVRMDAARRKHGGGRPLLKMKKKKSAKRVSTASQTKKHSPRKIETGIRFLKRFNTDDPRPGGVGVSIYVQHGYLAKRGDGYVRTDKPYPPPQ